MKKLLVKVVAIVLAALSFTGCAKKTRNSNPKEIIWGYLRGL